MIDGVYKPFNVPKGLEEAYIRNAEENDYDNPFDPDTAFTIGDIFNELRSLNLDDEFPFIENPLLPKPGGADAAKLPAGMNMPNIDTNLVSSQVQQTDSTNAQRFATLYPNG